MAPTDGAWLRRVLNACHEALAHAEARRDPIARDLRALCNSIAARLDEAERADGGGRS